MKYLLALAAVAALWFFVLRKPPAPPVPEPPVGSHLKTSLDRTHEAMDKTSKRNGTGEF